MSSELSELMSPQTGVPDGWQSSTLGEALARAEGGGTPPRNAEEYWNGDIPWASVKDIVKGDGSIPEETITAAGLANSTSRVVAAGTNIFAARMGVGAVTRYPMDVAINQDLIALTPGKGLDPDYLYHWLRSKKAAFVAVATGTTVKGIRKDLLLSFPLSLPPLNEQRRIAEVLRSVDEAIVATQAVYEAALSAQASAFETFLQTGNHIPGSAPVTGWNTGKIDGVRRLPAGWQIVKLVDVARLESGHTPDRKKPEYWDDGDVEWISLHDTQNLERCDISQTEMRITRAGLSNSSARLLPAGTVCFSRTATVGKCVIMAKSMATSQDFANFICSPKLNNRYLLHLMRWMQPVWKALASGSTHKTIYMPTFKALQIVLPSRAEQDSIAATMDGFVSVAEGHAASLTQLQSMKAAMMSDLLSGNVRVPA
jgi:type I restriction enzyme S subunit